nr:nucleic acid-binding, OB-fold protein [Tanacetum cinerariifolium]
MKRKISDTDDVQSYTMGPFKKLSVISPSTFTNLHEECACSLSSCLTKTNSKSMKRKISDTDDVQSYMMGPSKKLNGLAHSPIYMRKPAASRGKLFQQYIVTAYYAIEQTRLDYIRQNQNDIRNEYLSGIYDAIIRGDRDGKDLGTRTILSISFTGGPRYMYVHYLDALAICSVHGNQSFFITFTSNAKWPEIQEYMDSWPELTTADRADIVDHVFEQKDTDVDKYISAELPDPTQDPDGFRGKDNLQAIVDNLTKKKTTLTEWQNLSLEVDSMHSAFTRKNSFSSYIFRFKVYTLHQNMRLSRPEITEHEKQHIQRFSSWLLDIGDGNIGEPDATDEENSPLTPSAEDLQKKVIVCPKNKTADTINSHILFLLNEQERVYLSSDEATPHGNDGGETELLYSSEYLNSLNFPGLPPYRLQLKGNAIQANMDLKDEDYFDELLQLNNAYRIACFSCTPTKKWQQTLDNKTTLNFGKYTRIEPIPNECFPEHYFKFIAYNEVHAKADITDAPLTDYIGCIHHISDPIISGDATRSRKTRRIIDIQNLDGLNLPFLIWDEMAEKFDMDEYVKMPKPVVIAVSSTWVTTKYRGLQLSATPATYYYFNPNIPEVHYIIDVTTLTCFSSEAHTFAPDCNELVNTTENKDDHCLPYALKQFENTTHIFQYHFGKKARPGHPNFTLDAAFKTCQQPLLSLPAPDFTTSTSQEVLQQTSFATTPTPSAIDPHELTKDVTKESTVSSTSTKKTAKRELFPDPKTSDKKPRQQN